MDTEDLKQWLEQPRLALTKAVAHCIRDHIQTLRSHGASFYGYALLPGEVYDIGSIVAAHNCEADIKAPKGHEQYSYYRYSVDEWAHLDHDRFEPASQILAELNAEFRSRHEKGDDVYEMDEFEVAHSHAILSAILQGFEMAKGDGAFGEPLPFLVIWISDSSETIVAESVRRLNPPEVASEFMSKFG